MSDRSPRPTTPMRRTISGLATAVLVGLAALAAPACGPNPGPKPSTYERVSHTFSIKPNKGDGGYVSCPADTRVVAGGAFFHRPGRAPNDPFVSEAHIVASSPNDEGTAYYALGVNEEPGQTNDFTVVAHCVPKAQVAGSTLVRHEFDLDRGSPVPPGGYLRCPDGAHAYTGGAMKHRPGTLPEPGAWLVNNSTATTDGTGWYADSRRSLNDVPSRMTAVAHCLPAARLAQAKVVVDEIDVTGPDFQTVGSYVSCPAGHRILTGGAFWHRVGEPIDPEGAWRLGRVVSSSATTDAKGWFAAGEGRDARLTIVARCLQG